MDIIQRIENALVGAEKELAALGAECTRNAEYEMATHVIRLANELKSLARATVEALRTDASVPGETQTGRVTSTSSSSRHKRGKYPHFLRQANELVKVGWSPTERAEYEHKSPKEAVIALASIIDKLGANGKRFSMERIIPLEREDGGVVPDYQAYLCLAWLRELGLVVQHGRKGYSLVSKAPIAALIEGQWAKLPGR